MKRENKEGRASFQFLFSIIGFDFPSLVVTMYWPWIKQQTQYKYFNKRPLLQEGESVGSTILQLVVTDKDTPRNGPPFSFHIISGNEDRRFNVDQGGLLSLSAPLRKKVKSHHQLKIQVREL